MKRKIQDHQNHAHFITFSCYKRRKLLDDDRAKRIVIHFLSEQLKNQNGHCLGFVILPNHVHALVRFSEAGMLSIFMNQWKRRSSMEIKKLFQNNLTKYSNAISLKDPIWQPKYYSFNVFSEDKIVEKLNYMHNNPVKACLVKSPEDWIFGSAQWYLHRRSVGVPITPINEMSSCPSDTANQLPVPPENQIWFQK